MYQRFKVKYASRRDPCVLPVSPWIDVRLTRAAGYGEFAAEFAGASFESGLYRVHDDQTGPLAMALIAAAFPEFSTRACPFGYDWLGRQFALDSSRVEGDEPQVLLLEPGTGEALEIPVSLAQFHNEELSEHADAALARSFYQSWSRVDRESLPLGRDQCVGYRVPLFLGGNDDIENLEVMDLDVYWTLLGQLRQGITVVPGQVLVEALARRLGHDPDAPAGLAKVTCTD